jgi:hypothetical protein
LGDGRDVLGVKAGAIPGAAELFFQPVDGREGLQGSAFY